MGNPPNAPQAGAWAHMRSARRWLIASLPNKVPHYINGSTRGETDTPDDWAHLASYEDAKATLSRLGAGWILGFALGPDESGGHWQGIDFDDIPQNLLSDLANDVHGYVEVSPSRKGAHAIGYGRHFATLGHNGTGIEAYAKGRYFTVTEQRIRDGGLICLAAYIEETLAPRHGARRATNAGMTEVVPVNAKTVTELRSALLYMRAEDYHLWVNMGLALRELGETGRGLWMEWSATSEKFDSKDAAKKWNSFKPTGTSYQAVFAEAARHGWVNPGRSDAQLTGRRVQTQLKTSHKIKLEFAMSSDTETAKVSYLVDPFLPCKCVVGFFGRGGTAKSSFLATMAAMISQRASTLWVSAEELTDWIKARHIKTGGAPGTLQVFRGIETDEHSGQHIQVFGVYEHLDAALTMSNVAARDAGMPAVRLVVLDTAVALTIWPSGQGPNDDASVKRLLAYMQALAEKHDVTIAFIGHNNKRSSQNTEHFEDMVAGAGAWVTSPRVAFVHARDRREENSYVMRLAKPQLTPRFLVTYKTEPVHTLAQREDAPASVLCRVALGDEYIWGEDESASVFDAATGKDTEEDSGHVLEQRATTVQQVIDALVQMVHMTNAGQDVTRDMVHSALHRIVNGRRWKDVDDRLYMAQFQYRIAIVRGPNNQVLYRKMGPA
ncbi:AAA domain protein [Bordetella bronchiseptica OSU553]|nr:AAA domain protein [Bordetella bronchiseptica D756]KDD50093.1 AAA domain protein [Bordetella bronchiseptica OSU553]